MISFYRYSSCPFCHLRINETINNKDNFGNNFQAVAIFNCNIDSLKNDDEGILTLGSTEEEAIAAGKEMVMLIIDPPEAEVGAEYDGEVVSVATYGAFVNILPGRDGLLHVSKFHSSKRVNNTEAVVSVGDKIKVNVDRRF